MYIALRSASAFFVWESVLEYEEGKTYSLTTIAPLTGIDKPTMTICFHTKNFMEYGKDFLISIALTILLILILKREKNSPQQMGKNLVSSFLV